MNAFIYGVLIQWKLDLRNKGVLITYYVVPLIFFGFMGAIFSSINPSSKDTLIQSMTIFGVTMGAFLGSPVPLVELYGSNIIKAYKVGGIPLWMAAVNNFISAFIHLMITSSIIFFIAPFAFDARIPENVPQFFLSLSLFLLVSISFGSVLGLFIKNVSKLTMFSQLLFLPSLMLSGIMFPTNLLPQTLETIGYLFPATWGFRIMSEGIIDFSSYHPLILMLFISIGLNLFLLTKVGKE